MNKEERDLDAMLTGLTPADFATLEEFRVNGKPSLHDLAFNSNSFPFQADTAIIVTSYYGHLGWLKATLSSYRKSGHFVILAYDNNSFIWDNLDDQHYSAIHFPRPIHYMLAHATVVKHKTYDADKRIGWFWDVWYAQSIIRNLPNIKYVYITNGDCIVEKPEGFQELKQILGDGDLMSGQSTKGSTIHTAELLMKVDAFHKVLDYMTRRMKPYVMACQSPEALLRDAVDELGLMEVMAEQPIIPDGPHKGSIDYYCTRNVDSTWKRVLGFRNLYHEFEYHENNGLVPDFKRFMDPYLHWAYFRGDWRDTICRYYDTGDRRYLMMFWDRGKDSHEDRKFLPLEAYGNSPIYEEKK